MVDQQTEPPNEGPKPLSADEFVGLLLRHEARVRGFVASLMFGSSDVYDIFQSASLAAFRKLATFTYADPDPDEAFVRWVCTIARYEVLQVYRKRRTGQIMFNSDLIAELADMQIQQSEQLGNRAEALTDCIEHLSSKEKNLLQMHYGNELPVAEIARQVHRTANGVYKALERVRSRLLECIRRKLKMEGLSP
ncbi:MAG: sigma-70 family RNA polymerase sigma factor [Bythopirellula sp.]